MVPEQVDHELRQRLLVRDGLPEMRQQARNQRHALIAVAGESSSRAVCSGQRRG